MIFLELTALAPGPRSNDEIVGRGRCMPMREVDHAEVVEARGGAWLCPFSRKPGHVSGNTKISIEVAN